MVTSNKISPINFFEASGSKKLQNHYLQNTPKDKYNKYLFRDIQRNKNIIILPIRKLVQQ